MSVKRRDNKTYPVAASSNINGITADNPFINGPSSRYTESGVTGLGVHESPVIPDYQPSPVLREPETTRMSTAANTAARTSDARRSRNTTSSDYSYSGPFNARRVVSDTVDSTAAPDAAPVAAPAPATTEQHHRHHHPHGHGHHSGSHHNHRASSGQNRQSATLSTEQPTAGLSKRSPLQKLEADPWHLHKNKDAKRAQLEEAEMSLGTTQAKTARRVSARTGNGHNIPNPSSAVHRRAVSVPDQRQTSVPSARALGKQPVERDETTKSRQSYGAVPSAGAKAAATAVAATGTGRSPTTRGSEYEYKFGDPPYSTDQAQQASQIQGSRFSRDAALVGGAAALATAGAATASKFKPSPQSQPESRDSKKLQKKPPQDRRRNGSDSYYNYDTGNGNGHGTSAAKAQAAEDASPPYHTPPQQPLDTSQASSRKGLGIQQADKPSEHGFHLPHIMRRRKNEQRYVEGPVDSDWKSVPTVSLFAEDLDFGPEGDDEPQPAPKPNVTAADKAWWEMRPSERRRSADTEAQQTPPKPQKSRHAYNDASIDLRTGQSFFNPPIYLKCGPLLRFRGIYRETVRSGRASRTRDIWRGSIMIVTNDKKIRTDPVPPTLRLFKQPIELLPPPPTEVDEKTQVNPEYLDPVAGQVKMSRVGKTLYVRPVEELPPHTDLSRMENDSGLFQEKRSTPAKAQEIVLPDGEAVGKVKEAKAERLFSERGSTFWKWNIEIELSDHQTRIAYRINRGPSVGFWVPARGENMNMMFYSCNGFSLSVQPNEFSGPDPLWRDVLNSHQTRPFHVMIGGGDQLYMDAAFVQAKALAEWTEIKNPHHKHHAPFTAEMQDELETFFLNRYAIWFSQGFFGMANGQIPMVNIWDDHDIMDGYGSYSDHTMRSPVMEGVGAVAFKYYMLFQHQSMPEETQADEPSWLMGAQRGPYIPQLSRSLFMSMGRTVAFVGLDCRTERSQNQILSEETWDIVFRRLEEEIVKGQTKHLIVLLGIPIAYPRLNWLENILTSRAMIPVKELGRTGLLGGFVNKFDGAVEILDDLDDHWTAKHHKDERNWFIQELQRLSAEKSVRITILGGDVHLAAVGEFFSRRDLAIPKDRDHRYMVNVISSAIVNTPPGDRVANWVGGRNKIHHLDEDTDEDMIGLFKHDTDGQKRTNPFLFPKRNWCAIREYRPENTPLHSPESSVHEEDHEEGYEEEHDQDDDSPRRSFSIRRRNFSLLGRSRAKSNIPPISYYNQGYNANQGRPRASSAGNITDPAQQMARGASGSLPAGALGSGRRSFSEQPRSGESEEDPLARPNPFLRRPSDLSEHHLAYDTERGGHIDFTGGLAITINVENVRGEPEGTTTDYRLLVPALDYTGVIPAHVPHEGHHGLRKRAGSLLGGIFGRSRSGSVSHSIDQQPPSRAESIAQSSEAGPEVPPKRVGLFQRGFRKQDHTEDDQLGGWTDRNPRQSPGILRKAPPVAKTQPPDQPSNVGDLETGAVAAAAAAGTGAVAASRMPAEEVRSKRVRNSYPPPSSASPRRRPTDTVSPIDDEAPAPPPKDDDSPISPISAAAAGSSQPKAGVARTASQRQRYRGSAYDDEIEDVYIPIERRPSLKHEQTPVASAAPPVPATGPRNDYGYFPGSDNRATAPVAQPDEEPQHYQEEPKPKKKGWLARLTGRNRHEERYYSDEEEESHWSESEGSPIDEHHEEAPAPTRDRSARSFFASGRSARVAPYEDDRSPSREHNEKGRRRGSSWRFWRVAD